MALDIRRIGEESDHFRAALHMVFGAPAPLAGQDDPQVAFLLVGNKSRCVDIELLYGAFDGNRLISACLAVESPGRAAMILLSPRLHTKQERTAAVLLLSTVKCEAAKRSIRLLEALAPPSAKHVLQVLEQVEFRCLTTLLYLTRLNSEPEECAWPANDLSWHHYSEERESLFCDALELSYAQSLDCPELTGVRTPSAVLATHRARVDFDCRHWWVAMRGDGPVGVLLLNQLKAQASLEIVYIGVAQPSRGTGVADALLIRACESVRALSATSLTLAVDERNHIARSMYARWNFVEIARRKAFVATLPMT